MSFEDSIKKLKKQKIRQGKLCTLHLLQGKPSTWAKVFLLIMNLINWGVPQMKVAKAILLANQSTINYISPISSIDMLKAQIKTTS